MTCQPNVVFGSRKISQLRSHFLSQIFENKSPVEITWLAQALIKGKSWTESLPGRPKIKGVYKGWVPLTN